MGYQQNQENDFYRFGSVLLFPQWKSKPLFDPSQNKQGDEKKASKKGVSTKDDEYITIAPNIGAKQNETFICNMSTSIYKKYSTTETTDDDFTEYDKRMLSIVEELVTESLEGDTKGKAYKGTAVRHLTEDESINNIGASIAYAFNKKQKNGRIFRCPLGLVMLFLHLIT